MICCPLSPLFLCEHKKRVVGIVFEIQEENCVLFPGVLPDRSKNKISSLIITRHAVGRAVGSVVHHVILQDPGIVC